MNHNEIFRVIDTENPGSGRYCVSTVDDSGKALIVGDNPTDNFNWGKPKMNGKEISFDELPNDAQNHVVSAFGLTEKDDKKKCKCEKECKKCVAGSPCECDEECADMVTELWNEVVLSVLEEDIDAAKFGMKSIILSKFGEIMNPTLTEFSLGAIKIMGNDVYVSGKQVGSLNTDPNDHERGIVLTLDDGGEHEFDEIKELFTFLMDEFRIKESMSRDLDGANPREIIGRLKNATEMPEQLSFPQAQKHVMDLIGALENMNYPRKTVSNVRKAFTLFFKFNTVDRYLQKAREFLDKLDMEQR
jgi:hypothetical protein